MHALASMRPSRKLTFIFLAFVLAGCGQGDGPESYAGTAATPLPELPPGFCDPINFEILCELPGVVWFGGGQTVVVDNPDPSGINVSDMVARMQKFGDQPFGGSRLNPAEVPVDFSAGEVYKINVWSERSVPVTFKLEETNDGTLGVARVATHNGGSVWEELCFDFTGQTPSNTIGLTIIFDDGVLGGAIGGIFEGDWTFYYDDITQVESCVDTGPDTGIVPDVTLYYPNPAGDPPDLVIPDDYAEVTPFESESVIDLFYADDDTFSPVLAVSSGTGFGANIAQVGFIGFEPGFVTFYETLDFKVKGMPNFVIFVTLYEGGDPVRINLSSSDYSDALDNGWYQVSIPLSSFTGLTSATGIVFESDDTSPMQFSFFLNDIGFGGDGGDGGNGGGTGTSLGVFSETNTDPVVNVTNIVSAGNPVTIDTASTAVTPFDGAVSLGLTFSDNTAGFGFGGAIFEFDNADLSTYDTLKFSIDTSAFAGFANLTVQLEPPGGGTAGGNVALAAYTPVATSGNWNTYEIPLADFTAVNLSSVNRLGFFNARDGSDVLLAGTLYLDDIHFNAAGGGTGGEPGLGVFSETNTDPFVNITDIVVAGNPVTIDSASTAVTPFDGAVSLGLTFSDNTAGFGFGGAIFEFDNADLSTYDTLKFSIDTSAFAGFANLTVQLEPPGGGTAGGNVSLAAYTPVATSGNWNTYEIPLADFTAVNLSSVNRLGFFNARDGSDVLLAGTLYLDDIHFTTAGGNGGGGSGNFLGIVPDGDFENGTLVDPPWKTFANGGVVEISSAQANGGTFSVHLLASVGVGGPASFPILKVERLEEGNLTGGESVTVSFDAIAVDQQPGAVVFIAQLFTERSGVDTGASDEILIAPPTFLTGGWVTYTFNTTLGPDAGGGVSLLFKADCGSTAGCVLDAYVDNVSIVINGGGG